MPSFVFANLEKKFSKSMAESTENSPKKASQNARNYYIPIFDYVKKSCFFATIVYFA